MSSASSIWRRDLNPQPPEHESSPIITRPGLPPFGTVWRNFASHCRNNPIFNVLVSMYLFLHFYIILMQYPIVRTS